MSGAGDPTTSRDRPLRVRLLGGFRVEGFEEHDLGARKARLLLKRLAVAEGQPVPAAELADVVWPDNPPRNPGDQVSVLVSRLRAVLGADRLPRSDAGYCLAADWYDVAELDRLVAEIEARLRSGENAAALAAAQVALALAVGTLLPEEAGEWVEQARPAADRLVTRARLLAAEATCTSGEYAAARAAAQPVLDQDPYDESALRLMMRADALAGRPGMALASYAAYRERLAEDLGADPAPETNALHTAIMRGELSPASGHAAPSAITVVGRDAQLDLLDRSLARAAAGESTAVVVEAAPGMGKTTLLTAWTARASGTALVIAGRCDELGGDLPLQPVVDGLLAHLNSVGRDTATELVRDNAAIVGPLLSRVTATRPPDITTVTDADTNRAALFTSLSAVIGRAADGRPAVLVVEDLHKAASGTAEFLAVAQRRIPRLLVIATRRPEPGPDLPGAQRIGLGPLTLPDVAALVGDERAPALHARSGGHPLFLAELAKASDDELPASIVAAIRAQLDQLGEAAVSLEAAAICGTEIDAVLIAAITDRPAAAVLDDVERAARAGLLRPRGAALAFGHELVREAIEAATTAPRRRELHRAAVAELARQPEANSLALARHARLGGDADVAAAALVAAAGGARERFEIGAAEGLLDDAIGLADSFPARLARGRVRVARLDFDAAQADVVRALELGAGVEGFELAGWVAYYRRDYDTALRYAEEGVERATDAAVGASCLALAGRIRHTRGDLDEAARHFAAAMAVAPGGMRGMVQIWQAQLLAHRGDALTAIDTARRGLLDPHLAHPFAAAHGRFTLCYSLGLVGRWSDALTAADEFDALLARQGDARFPPVAANLRGWLLRGAGQLEAAMDLHRFAAEAAPGPTFQEAHYAALLDLAECQLAAADLTAANATIESAAGVLEWMGSMAWRHRGRYQLVAGRIGAQSGAGLDAAEQARTLAAAAAQRGDQRYERRALIVAATIDAWAGRSQDAEVLGHLAKAFLPVCGPDGWRDLGELAAATGSTRIWRLAEDQAALIVGAASGRDGIDGDRVARAVRHQLDGLKP
ncbi:MAG: hypothetical protein QOG49_1252 [Frankiaceae bacterium]|jgi:DNA-binding SARP family transcriptional activator|nr:hypothetical protein [Frankiaceae bacterium]